jgi:uracil-DNA glycosylase family 4
VDDGRGELRRIVGEAVVLLERQRARGRARIAIPAQLAVPQVEGPPRRSGFSQLAPEQVAPAVETPEILALPGFGKPAPPETLRPAATGSFRPFTPPASQPVTLHAHLPQDLPSLQTLIRDCRLCSLCKTRTQTVFADGKPSARLLLVGEAPGRDEDLQGLPFVGRAGQLLNKMLAAIELKREDVYICNVLKCRPPDNRTPMPDEVEQCSPYLEQQIALVKPVLIGALGLSAAQALLKTKASMASMRGRRFEYRGIPLVATYHPAALLRNPGLKRDSWVDLQMIRDFLRDAAAAAGANPASTAIAEATAAAARSAT